MGIITKHLSRKLTMVNLMTGAKINVPKIVSKL